MLSPKNIFFIFTCFLLEGITGCFPTLIAAAEPITVAIVSETLANTPNDQIYARFESLKISSKYQWPEACDAQQELYLAAGKYALDQYETSACIHILESLNNVCPWDNSATSIAILFQLALAYGHEEDRVKSRTTYQTIIHLNPKSEDKALAYYEVGYNFIKTRQLDSAQLYLNKAFPLFEQKPSYHYALALCAQGMTYYYTGQMTQAMEYYKQSLDCYHDAGLDIHHSRGNLLHRIALLHISIGEYTTAVNYINKELNIYHQLEKPVLNLEFNALSDLGLCHTYLGNYDLADSLYHCSEIISEALNFKNNFNTLSMAFNQECKGEHQSAIDLYRQCLQHLMRDYGPSHSDISLVYARISHCYLALDQLETAGTFSQLAVNSVEQLSDHMNHSFLYQIEPTFSNGFYYYKKHQTSKAPDDLKIAFDYINKAVSLVYDLQYSNTDISVISGLKKHLIHYLYQAIDIFVASYEQDAKEEELFNLIGIAEQLKADIFTKKSIPKKKINTNESWQQLGEKMLQNTQSKLAKDALVLYYFRGETKLHLLAIDKEQVQPYFSLDLSKITPLITEANRQIREHHLIAPLKQSMATLKAIILPLEVHENYTSLKVIPVDVVSKIPFDIFKESGKYLIEQLPICYGASLQLLLDQNAITPTLSDKRIHILNPFLRKENFAYLPGSDKEINFLKAHFQTQEVDHLNSDSSNSILHLSTHGVIHPTDAGASYILLAGNKKLYARDIAALPIKSNLAVLASCSSGDGKLFPGQGLLSLGRQFFIAGVPAILTARWEISDISSAPLMIAFYEHLAQGKDKDQALRLAKIDFLNNDNYAAMYHPFFWAGFSLQGNTAAVVIEKKTKNHLPVYLVILTIMVAAIVLRLKLSSSI